MFPLALETTVSWAWASFVVTAFGYLLAIALVPRVISERRESGATLAWVLAFVFIPYLGPILFWAFGTQRLRWKRRRRVKAEEAIRRHLASIAPLAAFEKGEAGEARSIETDVRDLGDRLGSPATRGNSVAMLVDGDATFARFEAAIKEAKSHVHVEFYIWNADATGRRMRDLCIDAAKRGCEVRVLVDDVGSRGADRKFFAPLLEAGGKHARFLEVVVGKRVNLNNRNHRKILVVDGRVGFTGGLNVGDEYLGVHGPWRDTHFELRGPSVLRLEWIFDEDWFHTTGEDLAQVRYYPAAREEGKENVQILASGPDDDRWHAIHAIHFAAITLARERVWITTPYFVPDAPLELALQVASLRGVDVRLLLPGRSDHALVLHAGRSFYPELLAAGVKIWELDHAFVHAKTVVVDGRIASIGSANLDQRSFRLNFEANAVIYGAAFGAELERQFQADLARARRVTVERFRKRPRHHHAFEALARIVAPLL